MRTASALVVAITACSGPARQAPHTPDTDPVSGALTDPANEPLDVEPPAVDAGAAPLDVTPPPTTSTARTWLKPTPVSWPKDRSKAQFHGLGGGTPWSVAIAVSADGSTPVGIAKPAGGLDEAVRWRNGTMSPLETLDLAGDDRSTPYAVSRDGTVVVGESTATETSALPVVWRADGKAVRLELPEVSKTATARAVSRDGKVIGGCAGGGCDDLFVWRGADAPRALLVPSPFYMAAHAMSDDGKVIAGTRGGDTERAVRVPVKGMPEVFPEGTHVEAISDDGAVMVGNIGTRAVLWRGKAAPFELGTLEGYDECYARAVSADGGRVIGNCIRRSTWVPTAGDKKATPPPDPQASIAFVWDKKHGMRSVADALTAAGVTLPDGWWLDEAFDICGYGVTIVGDARSPTSTNEAWMAILPR